MFRTKRNRFVFHPVHWVLLLLIGVLLLLIAAVLWIGYLHSLMIIPTPAEVGYEHSYFSPLPATAFGYFFRLNVPLLGWHSGMQPDKYRMSFSSAGNLSVSLGECVNYSLLDLKIAPGSLWGSFVHWEVREVGICGDLD